MFSSNGEMVFDETLALLEDLALKESWSAVVRSGDVGSPFDDTLVLRIALALRESASSLSGCAECALDETLALRVALALKLVGSGEAARTECSSSGDELPEPSFMRVPSLRRRPAPTLALLAASDFVLRG